MKQKRIYRTLFLSLSLMLGFSACGQSGTSHSVPDASSLPVVIETNTPSHVPHITSQPAVVATDAPAHVPDFTPSPEPAVVATDAPSHVPDFTPSPEPAVVATNAPAHVPDMTCQPTDTTTPPVTSTDWYQSMLETSILSTGTNGRLEKVIEKIKQGEPVSIMAYGGSITEGAGAENFSYSYGEQFIYALQAAYPNSSIHYHNSGLGGTPSTLGLMRYERDVTQVIGGNPDLVILEFAVNDYQEPTNGRAYESLVRTILEKENQPAIILLFSVFQSKWNLQDSYRSIGTHYGLPMVSIKDAIATAYSSGHLTDKEYFADIYHPTNYGHAIMADCLEELFIQVAKKETSQPLTAVPATSVYGSDFMGIRFITSQDSEGTTITPGSFAAQDTALQTFSRTTLAAFPNNWMHTGESGTESFKIALTCKNILLTHKYSNSPNFGKASVYIDGNYITELSGYLSGSWNNTETVLLLDQATAAPHVLEIQMSEGQDDKQFTILGIGYTP